MALSNFGSILGFALEIEKQNAAFFEQAATAGGHGAETDAMQTLAKNCHKRSKEIERTRRENVTEMILEKIDGFTEEPYTRDPKPTGGMNRDETIATARDLLQRSIKYYEEAGSKLKRLSEVARALKSLAKKAKRDIDVVADLANR